MIPKRQRISRDTFLILITLWAGVSAVGVGIEMGSGIIPIVLGVGMSVYNIFGLIASDPDDGKEDRISLNPTP